MGDWVVTARSLLFVPGSRPDRFDKALAAGAHAVIVDLEDAVAPAEKDAARLNAVALLDRARGAPIVVRLNALTTADGWRDVLALAGRGGVAMLPKLGSAEEAALAASVLGPAARLIGLIETADGLARAEAVARAPAMAGLMLGGADLAAELGCDLAWEPLLFARSRLVAAVAAAGRPLALIDVPAIDLEDEAALRETTARARALGFTARAAIHPRQVPAIHDSLAPSGAELARARRILAAAEASAGGVLRVDGVMVDPPVLRWAERVARLAGAGPR